MFVPQDADEHYSPAAVAVHSRTRTAIVEFWTEIWSISGPMLYGVLATGQDTWSNDLLLPIVQDRSVGEHYFTLSYLILDEMGQR